VLRRPLAATHSLMKQVSDMLLHMPKGRQTLKGGGGVESSPEDDESKA